jgi:type IV pilus assembly protein PilN
MIRINLLGQIRPRAARRPVDTGAALPALFIGAGAVLGLVFLSYMYFQWQGQLNQEKTRIQSLRAQKASLEQTKQQVEAFDKQRVVLQQRVSTIEQLQRDRTGSQELLDMVANTVSRTENLWLTTLTRKGPSLSLEGASASINSVANFITALKRSGYFQKVEIKESKQDERSTAVQTFTFQITAEIAPPPATQARPASSPAPAAAGSRPAKKG